MYRSYTESLFFRIYHDVYPEIGPYKVITQCVLMHKLTTTVAELKIGIEYDCDQLYSLIRNGCGTRTTYNALLYIVSNDYR